MNNLLLKIWGYFNLLECYLYSWKSKLHEKAKNIINKTNVEQINSVSNTPPVLPKIEEFVKPETIKVKSKIKKKKSSSKKTPKKKQGGN